MGLGEEEVGVSGDGAGLPTGFPRLCTGDCSAKQGPPTSSCPHLPWAPGARGGGGAWGGAVSAGFRAVCFYLTMGEAA